MHLLIFCSGGVILGGVIAWAGLVRGRIRYDGERSLTGGAARLIGLVCVLMMGICGILTWIGVRSFIAGASPLSVLLGR